MLRIANWDRQKAEQSLPGPEVENGELLFNGYKVSVRDYEKDPENGGVHIVNIPNATELYI